jgi:hypothetical protein
VTAPSQTQTELSSPLIDTIVTTTLIGITTASVTTSASSSPTLTTPLLGETIRTSVNPETNFTALSQALNSLPTATTSSSCTTTTNLSTGNISSSQQQPSSSPSNVSASRLTQSHILTLPHIDEDDEDENGHVPLPQRVSSYLVRKKVQNDNLINLNAKNLSNNNEPATTASSSLTPSPKIKVSRIKFNQPPQQLSLSSSASSDSESSVATVQNSGESVSPNKMQAESGSIAELQKYHNKYLKNRRHTLANTAAINLR